MSHDHPGRDPRRLGLGAAGIIAGYAVVVGVIAAGAREPGELGPPEVVPRPLLIAALCLIPAAIAAIGALRRSRPVLVAAAFVCLAQSFVAFSGITVAFIIPALLLFSLGASGAPIETPRRVAVGSILVVGLGLGAWVAPLALTEPSCWIARRGADGTVVYAPRPIPNTATFGPNGGSVELELGPDDLAAGCGGGELNIQGAALAGILGIGAVAMAVIAATNPGGGAPAEPNAEAVGVTDDGGPTVSARAGADAEDEGYARKRARLRGGLAGAVPAAAIAALYAVSGTAAPSIEVISSLLAVTGIAVMAGIIAGPLAARPRRRLLRAGLGYAVAAIVVTGAMSVALGVVEALSTEGVDVVAIATAVMTRAGLALISAAYFLGPAIVLGLAWSLAAHALNRRLRNAAI